MLPCCSNCLANWLWQAHALTRLWALQILDRVFMTYLVLVSAIWEMAAPIGGPEQEAAAVAVLDTLSYLHFCRMRLTTHTTLVQVLLQSVWDPVTACHACCEKSFCVR